MMPEPCPDPLRLPGAVPAACCARWLGWIADQRARLPLAHADWQWASGSMRLRALGPPAFDEIVHTVRGGPVGPVLRSRLGPAYRCLASQCWARRQVPARDRPAGQHPHEWHQDGALNGRFDSPDEGLLELLTVWIPLVPCGDDAPSLEWVAPGPTRLLPPAELTDAAVALRFGPDRRVQVRLAAGDALVFGGALLHRSHHEAAMTRPRDSVELRFVPAGPVPARLIHETLTNADV